MTLSYKPETKDNEVSDINHVVIEEIDTQTVVKNRTMTLNGIDDNIAATDVLINNLQTDKGDLVLLRAIIQAEAEKVKLKLGT